VCKVLNNLKFKIPKINKLLNHHNGLEKYFWLDLKQSEILTSCRKAWWSWKDQRFM